MADRTLTVNGQPFTFNRDRFAGVRTMTSGHVFPALNQQIFNETYYSVTRTDNPRNWVVENDLANDTSNTQHRYNTLVDLYRDTKHTVGKFRVTFDVELTDGSLADIGTSYSIRFSYRDKEADSTDGSHIASERVTEGSNVFDIELFDDGDNANPTIYLAHNKDGNYEVNITNLKVTHNYEEITVDRTADSGGRTMTGGHVYPPSIITTTSGSSTNFSGTETNGSWEIDSTLGNDSTSHFGSLILVPTANIRVGKHRVEFDITVNSGTIDNGASNINDRPLIFGVRDYDDDPSTTAHTQIHEVFAGANTLDVEVFDDGVVSSSNFNPSLFLSARPDSVFNITVSNIKVTHNYEEITVNRSSHRKGESRPLLSKVVGGAAAAYSLRDLNDKQGNNKVVRVRRASDNHERDFLAKEVSNGTLKNWVNTQTVLPLDIQAKTDDGRTGSVIPAAAAYSLRSLGTSQATLAATGDTVARVNGKYVCQVRRDSDDALKSFTADEITDGTLLAWVNEDVIKEQSDFTSGVDGYARDSHGTVTREASFEGKSDVLNYSWGGGRFGFRKTTVALERTSSYTITFEYYADSLYSGKVWGVENAFSNRTTASSNTPTVVSGAWTSATLNIPSGRTIGVQYLAFRIQENAGSSYGVTGNAGVRLKNIVVTQTTGSGFVHTWYDQSGNHNHAVQATAGSQPKIVDAGTLLTAGVTFDGGDSLSVSGDPVITASSSGVFSAFSVQTVATSEAGYLYGNASTSNGSSVYAGGDKFTISNKNSASLDYIPRSSGQNVLSAVYNNGDAGLLVNGAGTMTDAGTYGFAVSTSDFIIGNRNVGNNSGTFLTGSINEIIIYNSNQTDNRTAIEANIGDHYVIDLPSGVDTGYDQVDGFVETWYDQSGYGHNARQLTATNQPKIVDGGVLVERTINGASSPSIKFIAGDVMTHGLTSLSADGQQSLFFVADNQITSGTSHRLIEIMSASTDDGSNRRPLIFRNSSGMVFSLDSLSGFTRSISQSNFVSLYSSIAEDSGGGTHTVHQDGTQFGSASVTLDANSTIDLLDRGLGELHTDVVGAFFFTEIIYYPSDQTANRPAIEANIKNQYEIS